MSGGITAIRGNSATLSPPFQAEDTATIYAGGGPTTQLMMDTNKSPAYSSYREEQRECTSPSSDYSNLREELARLQEKEASLTHMLSLERDRRVKAEQLVEVGKMACFELKYRLCLEERKRDDLDRSHNEGHIEECISDDIAEGLDEEDDDTEEQLQDNEPNSKETDLRNSTDDNFDFATSVFGQLAKNLQRILGVYGNQDPTLQSPFSKALNAIKSNDPVNLQKCVSSLEPEDGLPLLKLAAERGHLVCIKVLLTDKKFNPDTAKNDGVTALHLAAKNGHKSSIEALLEEGVKFDRLDYEGHTPLFLALRGGHKVCAKKLLAVGSPLDVVSNFGHTLLHAAVIGRLPTTLRSLIIRLRVAFESSKVKEMINKKDEDYQTALHVAANRGSKGCVEVLCACEELDITQRDRWNRTPLDMASGTIREILLNRESKSIILYVRTYSDLPSSSSHILSSASPPKEGEEPSLAVGTIDILRHHQLKDLEQLTANALQQFSSCLNPEGIRDLDLTPDTDASNGGKDWEDGHLGFSEQIRRRYQLAKSFLQNIPKLGSELEYENVTVERESYLNHCKSVLKAFYLRLSVIDFSEGSISNITVGQYSWKAGKLAKRLKSKNLFNLIGELEADSDRTGAVHITLKGSYEGGLHQMSLDLMIPVPQLEEYVHLLQSHKNLMIHGPQGCGKTHLARTLADYMKSAHGISHTQVIHVSLHPSFDREDIFRLLHLNGLLLPAGEERRGSIDQVFVGEVNLPTSQYKTHILILDDLSLLAYPSLLSELLSILEYRGVGHSLWINEVLGRSMGEVMYEGGLYYLVDRCYVIGTWTTGSGISIPLLSADQFPHVSLGETSAPSGGVLRRQLMTLSIHHARGVWPYMTQRLYRLVQWVVDIWLLYNNFLLQLGLSSIATGCFRHFLSCPIGSPFPTRDIIQWLNSTWHHHLVPSIEFALQDTFSLRDHQDTLPQTALTQILYAVVGLVFLPTCPLSFDKCDDLLQDLLKNLDEMLYTNPANYSSVGRVTTRTPSPVKSSPIIHFPSYFPLLSNRRGSFQVGSSTTLSHKPWMKQKGTPALSKRRGSLSDLRLPSSLRSEKKAENMVSFQDMIRNSPQVRMKQSRQERKVESNATHPTSLLPNATHPSILLEKGSEGEEEEMEGRKEGEEEETEDMGRLNSRESKTNKALRKLRSKTISLFSRDGTGTLPRLFRRGSRVSLSSVSEEESKRPPIPPSSKREFTQSLDENVNLSFLYDVVATTSSCKEQRTPPTSSPDHTLSEDDRDAANVLNELDDFLDLLSSSTSDRLDNQRTAFSLSDHKPNKEVILEEEKHLSVPKYYLSTNSPHCSNLKKSYSPMSWGSLDTTLPTYSMPDLRVECVEEEEEDGELTSPLHTTTSQHTPWDHSGVQSCDQSSESHDHWEHTYHHNRKQSLDKSSGSHDHWDHTLHSTPIRIKSCSARDVSEQSDDGHWLITSNKNQDNSPESLGIQREGDFGQRVTSPLAMTSYTSQGRNSPEKHTSPQHYKRCLKKGTAKYFTYHPKRHRHREEILQTKEERTEYLQSDSKQDMADPELSTGNDSYVSNVGDVVDTSERVTEKGMDRYEKKVWNRNSCGECEEEDFSPDESDDGSQVIHFSDRNTHSPVKQSKLSRGRYVNEDTGMQYRFRSYSYAGKATLSHSLSSSSDENNGSKGPTRRRTSSYENTHGRMKTSLKTSSSENISSGPSIYGSGMLFGASLGFVGPDSSLVKSPVNSPTNSKDRLNSASDHAEV